MMKLAGCLAVFVAAGGLILSWDLRVSEQIKFLGDLVMLYQRAVSMLARQGIRTNIFFGEICCGGSEFVVTCRRMSEALSRHEYKTGAQGFREIFGEALATRRFDAGRREVVLSCGESLFEKDVKAMEERLLQSKEILYEMKSNMATKHSKDRRMAYPVGMLSALVLVIIFV